MNFTLENLLQSIGNKLKEIYPDTPVYTNPNQQGTKTPCFFIFFMPMEMEPRVGRRMLRKIGIDVVYITERNIPDAYDIMNLVGDMLDFELEFIPYADPYADGEEIYKLRTFDREWKMDDGELHYQFYVKPVVSTPDNTPLIEEIEEWKGGIGNEGYI